MADDAKIFVGGLSFETDEPVLEEEFGKFGNIVLCNLVKDRETNRSRGFAFITYDTVEDAKDAMMAMNGKTIDGRQIRVDHAGRSSGGRSRGYRGGQSGRGFSRGSQGGRGSGYGGGRYGGSDSRDYYSRSQGGYSRSGGSYRDNYDS